MRKPEIPNLFRAMQLCVKNSIQAPIFEQAAVELDKLEKIYLWAYNNKDCPHDIHTILYEEPRE